MTNDKDPRALWRSEIGDDAEPLWDSFRLVVPPEMDRPLHDRRQAPWMWFAMAASWLAIAALFAWNVDLQNDVSAAQERTALVLLATERSDRVLAGLAAVRQLDRDPAITAALLELLKTSDDPNVQLEALDLLLDDGLQDPDLRREVLEQVRFNRSFIKLAIQAREVRT
jgi:hypothetical protein